MSEMTKQRQHLFIVRIWQEFDRPDGAQWRGSVEHVPSNRRLYFTSLNDLNDFITWRMNSPLPPSPVDGRETEESCA
ncbi:MAG: hypothetical protein JXA21_20900 [Anaerolineae bacterium]|nr:hypothetical protein [Anaerolineae bacterium]